MQELHSRSDRRLVLRPDQPLFGVAIELGDQEAVIYFTDDDADALSEEAREPVKLAGVWSDLDAAHMLDELERLRHESSPIPPITDL